MKKRYTWGVISALLLSLVMTSGTVVESADTKAGQVETAAEKTTIARPAASDLAAMKVAAENESLALYFNEETTEVAVKNKKLGTTWYSNPINREQDAKASGYNKSILGSQLLIQYSDSSGKPQQYDNFNQSIKNKQYEIKELNDGIQITYTIGEKTKGLDEIPQFISEERFQTLILDKIEDERKRKDLEKRFKYDEEKKVYERRDAAFKGIGLSRVLELFAEIGYDEKERNIDREAYSGGKLSEQAEFVLPITYRLEKDQLVVNVSTEQIDSDLFHLQKLAVLPFFGAAGADRGGYMFVPDGSGSLIQLNSGKLDAAPYMTALYGKDSSRIALSNPLQNRVARLPVFGMKQENEGFVAIIENGDAIGNIEADISGRTNSYNYVFSSYELSASEQLTLSGNWNSQTVSRFQKQAYQGDITIRYGFLLGDDATYTGMAAYYRNYLAEKYKLTKLQEEEETPFNLELIGGITKKKFFLGIPYESYEALTTFDDAQAILQQLKDKGVNRIHLRYTGWFNGGVDHTIPRSTSVDGKLGGRKDFERLLDYAADHGIDVYPDAGFMQVYRDSWGFRPKKDGARYMTGKVAQIYPYYAANYMEDKSVAPDYVLSPSKLSGVVDRFLQDYKKYDSTRLSLRDLGNELHSDYNEKVMITREEAKRLAQNQLSKIDQSVSGLMINGGNAYSLPYADSVVNAPLSNSAYNLTDEAVPFYEIVLHGYIDYAGSALNMEDDQDVQSHILKALETGSNLNYTWFYAKSSAVKETEYNDLYAANYADWIDEAGSAYKEVNAVLRKLRNKTIIDHAKLEKGVYATTYEGGSKVIVNYNDYSVTADGDLIEAMGYLMRGDQP
ncbi:DUF5696 domain-containing protein [Paenibacillus sp. LHD-117]|uniref:DUF5696 domain-containing protein n=1 Tax=Paenibacillus sp. LHD-117 TaxID=3071412 RepID=UPI0027E11406|nr:DUF5696 domain-containing protein [Paenibacillus sp. LHD-117]MDQ6418422.1 DUF5696 domain-containing protein [Paenibacillus sp. LHD-117]